MSRSNYVKGRKIESVRDFAENNSKMFFVSFGKPQVKHRAFLESQQYRTLAKWCEKGMVCEAERSMV